MAWTRIGKDELGAWPTAFVHNTKGYLSLTIRHNTPEDYKRAKLMATLFTWALAGGWIWLGYTLYQDAQKKGQPLDTTAIWVYIGIAIGSLFVPKFKAERRMKKHPSTGRSAATFTIKKGWLYTPGRGSVKVEQFHSATASAHHKAAEELAHEQRHGYHETGPKKTSEVYRKSSQMQVNAGFQGAQVLGVTGFYNDPNSQYAGVAAAAVTFLVGYAAKLARGDLQLPSAAASIRPASSTKDRPVI